MGSESDARHSFHTLAVTPHPIDRRTVDSVRVGRIGAEAGGRYAVEVRMRDTVAILTAAEARALARMISEASHSGTQGKYWSTSRKRRQHGIIRVP